MFEPFINSYALTEGVHAESGELQGKQKDDINAFFSECGNLNLENGLYKTHSDKSSIHWALLISNYFPKYKEKIIPFGFDWMGRQFAVYKIKKNYIIMFDPATAEDFELQQNIVSFHNIELVHNKESTLTEDLFHEALNKLNLEKVKYDDCIGYTTPLFLGGDDSIDNYSISNVDVYWELTSQIYNQIKDLPPGTKVNSIKFEKK